MSLFADSLKYLISPEATYRVGQKIQYQSNVEDGMQRWVSEQGKKGWLLSRVSSKREDRVVHQEAGYEWNLYRSKSRPKKKGWVGAIDEEENEFGLLSLLKQAESFPKRPTDKVKRWGTQGGR